MVNMMSLHTLLVVAAEGSMVKAGQTLGRAQSAISRAIQILEAELGVELLDRMAIGSTFTEAGVSILPRAQSIMGHLSTWLIDVNPSSVLNVPRELLNARRLEMFTRLVRARNMRLVARQMGVTQPAISVAISVLEETVGMPLFTRTSSGVDPTGYACVLAASTATALNELNRIPDDARWNISRNRQVV